MSFWRWVAAVLLAGGIGLEAVCCLGVLTARSTLARLHYVAPAGVLGPVLIAAAIVVREGHSMAGIKAIVTACLLLAVAPVLTHVTADAEHERSTRR